MRQNKEHIKNYIRERIAINSNGLGKDHIDSYLIPNYLHSLVQYHPEIQQVESCPGVILYTSDFFKATDGALVSLSSVNSLEERVFDIWLNSFLLNQDAPQTIRLGSTLRTGKGSDYRSLDHFYGVVTEITELDFAKSTNLLNEGLFVDFKNSYNQKDQYEKGRFLARNRGKLLEAFRNAHLYQSGNIVCMDSRNVDRRKEAPIDSLKIELSNLLGNPGFKCDQVVVASQHGNDCGWHTVFNLGRGCFFPGASLERINNETSLRECIRDGKEDPYEIENVGSKTTIYFPQNGFNLPDSFDQLPYEIRNKIATDGYDGNEKEASFFFDSGSPEEKAEHIIKILIDMNSDELFTHFGFVKQKKQTNNDINFVLNIEEDEEEEKNSYETLVKKISILGPKTENPYNLGLLPPFLVEGIFGEVLLDHALNLKEIDKLVLARAMEIFQLKNPTYQDIDNFLGGIGFPDDKKEDIKYLARYYHLLPAELNAIENTGFIEFDKECWKKSFGIFMAIAFDYPFSPEGGTLSGKNHYSFGRLLVEKDDYPNCETLLNEGFCIKGDSNKVLISGSTYLTNQKEKSEVLDSANVGELLDKNGVVCAVVGALSDGCGHSDNSEENESIGRVSEEVCKLYVRSGAQSGKLSCEEVAKEIKKSGEKSKHAKLSEQYDATSTFTSAKIVEDINSPTGYTAICTNLGDSHLIILDGQTGKMKYQMPAIQKKRYENHFTPQAVQNFDENDICVNFYPVKPDDVILLFSDGYSDELDTCSELSENGNQRLTYIKEHSISQLPCTKNLENTSCHEIGLEFTQNIAQKNYERRERIKTLKEHGIEDEAKNAYLKHGAEAQGIIDALKALKPEERIEKLGELKEIQRKLSNKEGDFHKEPAKSLQTYIAKLENKENLATYEWNNIARAISSEFTIESFAEQLPDELKRLFLNQLQEKGYSSNIPFMEFLPGLSGMLKPTGDDATLLVMKVPDIKIREQIRALIENPENAQIYLENLKYFPKEEIEKACEKLQKETKFEGETKPFSAQENIKIAYSEDKIKEASWIIKTYQESDKNILESLRPLLDQKPEEIKLSFKGIVALSKAFRVNLEAEMGWETLKKEVDNLNDKSQKLSLLEFAIKQPIWDENQKKKINDSILSLKATQRFDLLKLWDDLTKTGCVDQPRIGDTKRIGGLVAYFNFSKESYENLMEALSLWLNNDFNRGFSDRFTGVYSFSLIVKELYLQKIMEENPCIENRLEQLLENWAHSLEAIKDNKENFFSSYMKDFEEILNGRLSIAEKIVLVLDLASRYESDFGHNLYRFFSCIGSEERQKEKKAVKNFFDEIIKDMNLTSYIDSQMDGSVQFKNDGFQPVF